MSSAEILVEKVAAMELSDGDDPYRGNVHGESEKNTVWRHGAPPSYTLVNILFERTRTKVWPKGSLEETVQNLAKTWEMELSHKTRIQDFKTIDPNNFSLSVNGRPALSGKETLELGSYNALMQTSLPEEFQYYKTSKETFESSHEIFRTAFPGGFAWEVREVYTGPPVVNFKFRHWGVMEGPFKGHAPTGQTVQFTGIAIAKVDEKLRMKEEEIYYDPAELCGGLFRGPFDQSYGEYKTGIEGCPFLS
ncbi:pathogen-related protein-like [Cryptomeria japonica]|uniref:pathogen-related protein-like n=1 Tax=Cryptomeria japonica TaxID=3369 RepID=UPI0025ACA0E8|nr:pathogen-related protein-like [Cryptomeria japonica]